MFHHGESQIFQSPRDMPGLPNIDANWEWGHSGALLNWEGDLSYVGAIIDRSLLSHSTLDTSFLRIYCSRQLMEEESLLINISLIYDINILLWMYHINILVARNEWNWHYIKYPMPMAHLIQPGHWEHVSIPCTYTLLNSRTHTHCGR